ncbi:MAG TPA: Bcr/CflA family multidrug efflux MFS transporter [Stellaceae bacterium]|nr:Bcr/CflA family multidrug efflux MFS transporter [Stellaceae bacterium]
MVQILAFGFLTAMAPLSVDIYLPALPMLQKTFASDEARTLLTLSAFLVGFGAGQLFIGPLSDRFGRKRPLIAGLALYLAASVACALASSIGAVILWRFLQAVGGCAVPVMVQAMIRDLFDRNEGARVLSLNMLVMGVAPIAAPLLGGQLMLFFDWRAIFWVLALFGAIALGVASMLPETLSRARRDQAHPVAMILGYGELFGSRRYVGYVVGLGFYYCALFAFIAGSPFVYIDHFAVSPQNYGFLFGINIVGMMTGSFINARIVVRHGGDRLLRVGKIIGIAGGIVLAITGTLGIGGIYGVAIPAFIVLSTLSMIGANAISGALALFPHRAGAASALAGALQFGMGALAGAVVGWLADGTPGPMCMTMAGAAALALLLNLALVRRA